MPRPTSRINQHAIAKKLGLSVATVSRSLADHPKISVQTKERVAEVAREMGYKKSSDPSEVSEFNPRMRIGVLVGIQPNSSPLATFPHILKGIDERTKAEGISVDVEYVDPNGLNPDSRTDSVMRLIRERKWKGIILVYSFGAEVVKALADKIPVVATLEDYDRLKIDSIDTNHYTGIATLVRQLVAMNHKRIGFVTWSYAMTGHWVSQRFASYVAGIFEHGLEFRSEWILNMHKGRAPLNPDQIADAVISFSRRDKITAWVCGADHQAYQLMLDLSTRGFRVPEDCSITGFDGIEPPLSLKQVTTLRVPNEAIGAAAVARLINRIAHPKAHQRKILVDTQFVEGATIAPRKSRTA